MTNQLSESPEEEITRLQEEVRRLAEFQHWFRMHGQHAPFCPAREKTPGKECTCGFNRLYDLIK